MKNMLARPIPNASVMLESMSLANKSRRMGRKGDQETISCPHTMALPVDLWRHIVDFLQSTVLSHVCRHLRRVVQRQYVVCNVDNANACQRLRALQGHGIGTLRLTCSHLEGAAAEALAALAQLPFLRALHLDLERGENSIGDSGAEALSALRHVPKLAALQLNLYGNSIGPAGTQVWCMCGVTLGPSLTTRIPIY